jgi:hypothetical protein
MIRPATHDDIPALVGMLIAFQEEAGCYGYVEPCRDSIAKTVSWMIENPGSAAIWVDDKGDLAALAAITLNPLWCNHSHKQAQEMWWYVKPAHRGGFTALRFRRLFDAKAKEWGANSISLASSKMKGSERLDDFYRKDGFAQAETFFVKKV